MLKRTRRGTKSKAWHEMNREICDGEGDCEKRRRSEREEEREERPTSNPGWDELHAVGTPARSPGGGLRRKPCATSYTWKALPWIPRRKRALEPLRGAAAL